MKEVTSSELFDSICKDFNIDPKYKDIKRFSDSKINAFHNSIIVVVVVKLIKE